MMLGFITCIFVTSFLIYAGTYAIYHDKYDMNNGCPKNSPQCSNNDRLKCHNNSLIYCFFEGFITFFVIAIFISLISMLVIVSMNIYYECNVEEKQDNTIILKNLMTKKN